VANSGIRKSIQAPFPRSLIDRGIHDGKRGRGNASLRPARDRLNAARSVASGGVQRRTVGAVRSERRPRWLSP
jgi:hypothetical protein